MLKRGWNHGDSGGKNNPARKVQRRPRKVYRGLMNLQGKRSETSNGSKIYKGAEREDDSNTVERCRAGYCNGCA